MSNYQVGMAALAVGAVLFVVGMAIQTGGIGWFGYLPGDLRFEQEAIRLFIPVTSMIVVSVVLTTFLRLVFFMLRRVV